MNERLRYPPNPPTLPIAKFVGGVDKFDIYISSDGSNYVVRYSADDSFKFPVKPGAPPTEMIMRRMGLPMDKAERISKMIELFG